MRAVLPTEGLEDLPSHWGVEVIGPNKDSGILSDVRLPPQWKIAQTKDPLRTELVDPDGLAVAVIFHDPKARKAELTIKKSFEGVPVVVGHRSMVQKYAGRKWSEVESAAMRGDDGL